jgi:preprotein translocase subunit SecD
VLAFVDTGGINFGMKQRDYIFLGLIILFLVVSIFIVTPGASTVLGDLGIKRNLDFVLGLDLQGGVQALLEVPANYTQTVTTEDLENAKTILESRTNALGVSENQFQVAGERRIVAEFPGLTDPEQVLGVIKETGQMEFVDLGDNAAGFQAGDEVKTDIGGSASTGTPAATPTPAADGSTTAVDPSTPTKDSVYHTIMTGDQLKSVLVGANPKNSGGYVINFELKPEGTKIFSDYTQNNIGKTLAVVLDKKILSAPTINSHIPEGQGYIENFDNETANNIAVQMRYGALPIPFEVVEQRLIGPTLGMDSLRKSIIAGMIGFAIVILFMGIYYRLPGIVAIFSILVYALLTLALFKFLGVTLTLPGIAGFLLSTGSALDSNILLFERLKEELRNGRTLMQAVDLGWRRAWPSIRDSNIATIIICVILFWFGSYGATIVKGFAVTLLLGVFISLLCAFVVTRTVLNLVFSRLDPAKKELKWFGITE